MTNPTELDVFSCSLDGATLIEASAGTGKTWNICGLYLRLLLEREMTVQQILVVTFTKAATAELRQRIRDRIADTLAFLGSDQVATGDPFVPQLIHSLTAQHQKTPQRLRELLNLALQTFDQASIFTIHSFCQRALADTPFAAGMPFATELLADDSTYLLQAVQDFWRQHIGNDAAATPLPNELAAYLLDLKDTPAKLAKLLRRHVAKPRAHYRWPQPNASVDAAQQAAQLFSTTQALWRVEEDTIRALLLQAQDDLKSSHNAEKLTAALDQCATFFSSADTSPLAPSLKGVQMKLLRQSTLHDAIKKSRSAPTHPFFNQIELMLEQLPALQQEAKQGLQIARLELIRTMLQDAAPRLRQQKRTLRLASYDDLLFNLAEALAKDTDHDQRLAESLRARYPAALIDEFQDTDPLQWEIFEAIYGRSEASVFLVGDPKQAIYSFRNADLHTYLHAKQQTRISHTLSANQRASAGLIEGLNALFGANPAAFMLRGLDYQRVEFGDKPRTVLVDHSEPRADLQLWMLPGDDTSAIERGPARRAAINATVAEISRLIRAAHDGQIALGERALQPGDIAILVRSHAQGSDMRSALAALGIGSVELSQANVFDSSDAADLESVLCAILEPTRTGLLLAALATSLLGRDATTIAALSADEKQLLQQLDQFSSYREHWLRRGIGSMLRQLFTDHAVSRRLLNQQDGERHLTNLLHLIELLHQASVQQSAPEMLLRWLQTKRRTENGSDEAAQLRLESDQDLVQIVTIHKSKGLEYPIVFCPFLWIPSRNQSDIEGLEYHADDGTNLIDFSLDQISIDDAKQVIRLERAAEDLRLIYVALTRAAQRCYLVAGTYSRTYFGTPSLTEGMRNLLNWLVAGANQTPEQWLGDKHDLATINQRWRELAQRAAPHIGMTSLPQEAGTPVRWSQASVEALHTPPLPPPLMVDWRSGSFSGLVRDKLPNSAHSVASDHDERVATPPMVDSTITPVALASDDILRFPRGPAAGDCLHAVLEVIEFERPESWPSAIAQALRRYPQPSSSTVTSTSGASDNHAAMIAQMLNNLLTTPLHDGLQLNTVTRNKRLSELEFRLPAHRLQANSLNQILQQYGYQVPELSFRELNGYLNGFIDLVFEHQQRFYIVDWKSNYLGASAQDYGQTAIDVAMREHRYHLQYLLYCVALQRYLRQRLPDYQYQRDFGGVLYLFVRGVRPGWMLADGSQAGVFFDRPSVAVLDALEQWISAIPSAEPA